MEAPTVPWTTHLISAAAGMLLSCTMLYLVWMINFPGNSGTYIAVGCVIVAGCWAATKHRAFGVGIALLPVLLAGIVALARAACGLTVWR